MNHISYHIISYQTFFSDILLYIKTNMHKNTTWEAKIISIHFLNRKCLVPPCDCVIRYVNIQGYISFPRICFITFLLNIRVCILKIFVLSYFMDVYYPKIKSFVLSKTNFRSFRKCLVVLFCFVFLVQIYQDGGDKRRIMWYFRKLKGVYTI